MSIRRLVPLNAVALPSAPLGEHREGDLYYNTTEKTVYAYDGAVWSGTSGSGVAVLDVAFQAPSDPDIGQLYFDRSTNSARLYDGSGWGDMGGNSGFTTGGSSSGPFSGELSGGESGTHFTSTASIDGGSSSV